MSLEESISQESDLRGTCATFEIEVKKGVALSPNIIIPKDTYQSEAFRRFIFLSVTQWQGLGLSGGVETFGSIDRLELTYIGDGWFLGSVNISWSYSPISLGEPKRVIVFDTAVGEHEGVCRVWWQTVSSLVQEEQRQGWAEDVLALREKPNSFRKHFAVA